MAHTHGHTGNVMGDIIILTVGWASPTLLSIGAQDVQQIADVLIPIGQIATTLLVAATALVRYRKNRKDKNEE